MRPRAALALALLLWGCEREAAHPALAADPESAAVELLSAHVFDPPEALRARFVPELDPTAFPLRLVAGGPDELTFTGIWRLRMVDERAVVTARLDLRGEPHLFELWLERRGSAWRIAGHERAPRPLPDPEAPAPPAGAALPGPLAAATFRGVHAVPFLPVAAPEPPEGARSLGPRVELGFKPPVLEGDCRPAALRHALERLEAPLRACYARALPDADARPGRVTFALSWPRPDRAEVALAETTLVAHGLSTCLGHTLASVPRPADAGGEPCRAQVALTFTPAR